LDVNGKEVAMTGRKKERKKNGRGKALSLPRVETTNERSN
jgi:hypothetical protein